MEMVAHFSFFFCHVPEVKKLLKKSHLSIFVVDGTYYLGAYRRTAITDNF